MLMLEQGSDRSYEHRRALVIKICRGLSDNTGYAAVTQADQHVSLGDRRWCVSSLTSYARIATTSF
jgi:hypothetical protein